MIKILLIRHALTDEVGKILSGRTSGLHLNKEGREQSKKLAERLAHMPVEAIYSSPLERAYETAEPLSRALNLICNVSDDFNEIDFGSWTNLSINELKKDKYFQYFNTYRSATRIPGGELMMEAQLRIVNGLEKLHIEYRDKTVAVFSHSDLIKSAIAHYAGIHLDMINRIEISPASLSVIELFDDCAHIAMVNNT